MKDGSSQARRTTTRDARLCRGARRGFTLLEMILALGLTMMLVATSLAFFQQVVRMRAAAEAEMVRLAAARVVFDRLTQELRVAYHDPGRARGLTGTASQIEMLVTALPEPAAWIDDELVRRPVSSDLRRIRYRLAGGQLERIEQRQVVGSGDVRTPSVTRMTDQLRFVHFRYWDGQTWQHTWSAGPLPAAVEVRLGAEPLPDDTDIDDYPFDYQRRVIAIAAAVPSDTTAPLDADTEPDQDEDGDDWDAFDALGDSL